MTTYTSEPGTRLGGRYRLEDRIAAGAGWDAWKAIDETLARAVTVFTLAQGFPRIADVVTAARAASRLSDTRLAQVFDVEDAWDRAYIVMEWATGDTLSDLLSAGPLEPGRGARIIAEAAAALSSAHSAGVAHLCLSPGSVRWSPTGEVKVVGLGIDAALSGTTTDDPVLADTRGLGRLLYAALTGCWPGPECPPLPPAPLAGGEPRSPRQVVAGIPIALSDLACRALQLQSKEGSPPVISPGELAGALKAAMPPAPIPSPPPPSRRERRPEHRLDPGDDPYWPGRERPGGARQEYDGYRPAGWQQDTLDPGWSGYPDDAPEERYEPGADGFGQAEHHGHRVTGSGYGREQAGRQSRPGLIGSGQARRRGQRTLPFTGGTKLPIGIIAGVAALATVAVLATVAFWPGGSSPHRSPGHHPGHTTGTRPPSTAVVTLVPSKATGFDPLSSKKKDPGNEQTAMAPYAIDSNPKTAWNSQWYATAEFGGLKTGAGLMIDMGKPVTFRSVVVTFGTTQPGGDVELLVGNSAARSAGNLQSMTTVASANGVSGTFTFRVSSSATGRYLVIWFTKLPPKPHSHTFMAEVFNVAIRGIQ